MKKHGNQFINAAAADGKNFPLIGKNKTKKRELT